MSEEENIIEEQNSTIENSTIENSIMAKSTLENLTTENQTIENSTNQNPIIKSALTYPSAEQGVTIAGLMWQPDTKKGAGEPKAILQISHGMVEFIDRYDSYAKTLAQNGVVVVGNDHIGHGSSVISEDFWGALPYKKGAEVLVSDMHSLKDLTQKKFGKDIPYFVHGHSMGSFVVRKYITDYPEGLAGAIIEGTGNPSPIASGGGKILLDIISLFKGKQSHCHMVNNLVLGEYSKSVDGAKSRNDWISTDEDVVFKYNNDPRSSFSFTLGGYKTLLSLTAEVATEKSAKRIPKDLPILIESGDKDPVGEMGKVPLELYNTYKKVGISDVTLMIVENARHELHNDFCREDIYKKNLNWILVHADVKTQL